MVIDLKPSCSTGVHALWQRIKAFELDDASSEVKFSDRLAKENLWSKQYARRVIEEYKRFMFLACISKDPVTPSLEVDECWHLHMLYTQDYWKAFTYVLGKEIHHGPTRGGKEEDNKFVDWYLRTKIKYYMYFSEMPPSDIWPPSEIRFRHVHFARVDLLTHWVFPAGDWRAVVKCLWRFIKLKIKQLW